MANYRNVIKTAQPYVQFNDTTSGLFKFREGFMKGFWLRTVAIAALTTAATANAADLASKAPPVVEPSWWQLDAGVRYWVSSGRMAKDLFSNVNPNVMVSRLTYDKTDAQSAEQFYRFEHRPTGLFV